MGAAWTVEPVASIWAESGMTLIGMGARPGIRGGAGEEEGVKEADFEKGGLAFCAVKGGPGLIAVGEEKLKGLGVSAGGEGTQKHECLMAISEVFQSGSRGARQTMA